MTESKSSNRKINYKSDFSFILDLKHLDTKNSEQDVGFPNYDFTILLYTNKFKKYVVKYTKNPETFVNCAKNFDGNLQIILNNHRLGQGVLYAEVYLELPNESFPDGKQLQVCPIKLDIELVDECTEELEDDDVIFIAPYIKGDKGDKGDPLTWESMSEYDKEDLVGKVKVVVEEDAPFAKGEGTNSAVLKGSDTTKAQGNYAIAVGLGSNAEGTVSFAEGYKTTASGDASHAEGSNTQASGEFSHAEGEGTIASNIGEHAEGLYNKSNINTLHSVGCGNVSVRKNAHEITNDGKHYILGVGGYDGTNPKSSQDIVTVLNGKTDIAYLPVLDPTYGGTLSDAQFEEYYRVWNNKGILIFYGGAPQIMFNRHWTNSQSTIYSVGTETSDDGTVKVYKCEVHKHTHQFTIQLIGTNSSAQPDWMVNPGEDGYIKNRTHYVDPSWGYRFDSSRSDYMEIKNDDGDIIAIRFTASYDQTTASLIWHNKGSDFPYERIVFNIGDKKSICGGTFDVSYDYGEGYGREDYNTYFTFSNFVDPIEYVLSELLNLYEDWDNRMVHPLDDFYIPDSVKITLKEVSSTVYKDVF